MIDSWLQEDSHLLRLPDELLLQIIIEISPLDITRFSLSCKKLLALSSDYVREARELYPEYSQMRCNVGFHYIDCYYTPRSDYRWPCSLFARQLILNPRIGRYVESLKIYDHTDHDFRLDVIKNHDVEYHAALLEVMEKVPYLNRKQIQTWIERIEPRPLESWQWDLPTAVVLSLLSHLQHLQIISYRPSSPPIQLITYLVQKIAFAKAGSNISQAWNKLSSVALFIPLTFELAASFAALPSVRCLTLQLGALRGQPFQGWSLDRPANITELKIFRGSHNTDDVLAFLDNLPLLRSFFYQIKLVALDGLAYPDFSPNLLCQALVKNGKARLEKLYIGAQDRSPWDNGILGRIDYIESLQDFQALKILHLECSFIDSQNFPGLPASLESFELYGAVDGFCAWRNTIQVLEYDEEVLPNLRELVVWGDEVGKKMRDRCTKKRVVVIVPSTLASCWEDCTNSGEQAQKACRKCKRSMNKGALPRVRDSYPFGPWKNELRQIPEYMM